MRDGWSYKKLGEVCEIRGGATPLRTNDAFWTNGNIPWFTIDDIREQGKYITHTNQKITEAAKEKLFTFPKGTIMLCCTASLGACSIAKIELTSNQQFNGLMIKNREELLEEYLYYFATTLTPILLSLSGKATINFVSRAKVEKIEIPIPPLATQQQIVSELDILSHILDQKRQQLKEYDALAESIFYDMFGDPSSQTIFECKKLSEITKSCGGGTPSKAHPEYWNGGIPWVSSKDMKSMYIGDSQMHITQEGVDNSAAKLLPIGTILLVTRSGILKHSLPVAITTAEITINQDLKALIVNPSICISVFLLYCLKAYAPYLLGQTKAVTVDSIDFSVFKNLTIPLPPLSLQETFAAKIESIEHQKQLLRASIKETEMLFQSRMDYWFNG